LLKENKKKKRSTYGWKDMAADIQPIQRLCELGTNVLGTRG
jgi:hypothetical protein